MTAPVTTARRDRVPPHHLESEESVLGAMMLSRDACAAAIEQGLAVDDFYRPTHGMLFAAIIALYDAYEPVDPVSVANELRRRGQLDDVGGSSALLHLQAQTPASANASHYARVVHELALLRRLIAVAGEISELGYADSGDVRETLDRAEQLVFEIGATESVSHVQPIADILAEAIDRLERDQVDLTGVPTGYQLVDDLLLGLQPNALYIVGGRPSMGKTAFALGITATVARRARRPVLFFSMEMGPLELGQRLIAQEARVDLRSVQRSAVRTTTEWNRVARILEPLAGAPLFIDDNPHCTIHEIRATARRVKSRQRDLGLVVVDYLQLMTPPRGRDMNREREVAETSRGLKILARELECPVIALSQLSREVERRADPRPTMADLRESGAQENDADVVMLLYRDEVYHPDNDATRGIAEVIVAKHRNGPTGVCELGWLDYCAKFVNLAHHQEGS